MTDEPFKKWNGTIALYVGHMMSHVTYLQKKYK